MSTFCILQIFATIDVVALMISTQDLLQKKKKKSTQEASIDSIIYIYIYKCTGILIAINIPNCKLKYNEAYTK